MHIFILFYFNSILEGREMGNREEERRIPYKKVCLKGRIFHPFVSTTKNATAWVPTYFVSLGISLAP